MRRNELEYLTKLSCTRIIEACDHRKATRLVIELMSNDAAPETSLPLQPSPHPLLSSTPSLVLPKPLLVTMILRFRSPDGAYRVDIQPTDDASTLIAKVAPNLQVSSLGSWLTGFRSNCWQYSLLISCRKTWIQIQSFFPIVQQTGRQGCCGS